MEAARRPPGRSLGDLGMESPGAAALGPDAQELQQETLASNPGVVGNCSRTGMTKTSQQGHRLD